MYELSSRTTRRGAHAASSAMRSFSQDQRQRDSKSTKAGSHGSISSMESEIPEVYPPPGSFIASICGSAGLSALIHALYFSNPEEAKIRRIAHERLGMHYATISDLNNTGSAFCSLFWSAKDSTTSDEEGAFVVVAFRGTAPTEFGEWLQDFRIQMREAGLWVTGFGRGMFFSGHCSDSVALTHSTSSRWFHEQDLPETNSA
jgi:hypothetical protein